MDLKTCLLSLPVPERHRLARACGTSYAHLRNVAYGSKTCAESLAINIDRETSGRVRCEELRPDVDWAYLRRAAPAVDREAGQPIEQSSEPASHIPLLPGGEFAAPELRTGLDRRGAERRQVQRRQEDNDRRQEGV